MKASPQVVQLTGHLPPCREPPENQDIFDWNNFDDYSVGSSSQGYLSPGYQEGGNTGSEMSYYLNQGQVSTQGMNPMSNGSNEIMINENPQNIDRKLENIRGECLLSTNYLLFN